MDVYVFLPPLPPLLLLVMDMVETYLDSVAIILQSASILLEIVALDLLSVALAWVILAKEFWLLALAYAIFDNASSVLVWYDGAGVWVFSL